MSAALELARYALGYTFADLPLDVVHQAKRLVLDTLGCAIGGSVSDASLAIQKMIQEFKGPREATVFGSGLKTSCLNATLANGAMARFLDYNDVLYIIPGRRTGNHPSEIIPPVLALAERQHLSGKEAITAIVAGYDLSFVFLEAVTGPGMKGWEGDTRGAYIMPLIAGRLLGLTETQMENAVGICASCHSVMGILDAPEEEYTMAKNIRFPTMSYGGILAALLARKGFTGPARIIEGQDGFATLIMQGNYDPEKLKNPERRFAIREACIKSIVGDYSTHGYLAATLKLVNEHKIRPQDIAEVRIRTSKRCADHTTDPIKKFPRNKETADHSSYYLTAVAIADGRVGPEQFTPEKYQDPQIRELIEKISVQADPELDPIRPAGISEIITKRGEQYSCRVDFPQGHARNPMTDGEIIDKFKALAGKYMGEGQINRIVHMVFELDKIESIGRLNRLMVFKKK